MLDFNLTRLLLWLPAVIIALTFHEYAHARVADKLGDPTARHMGRMSLNPLVHLDPLGFILLLVAGFGWAKPVPVNPLNIRGDRLKGMMLISAAGPLMNIFVAFSAALVLNFALPDPQMLYSNAPLVQIMWALVIINVYLALFNLIPVPPLDGSKVLAGLLGSDEILYKLERYSMIILLVLIFSGFIGMVLFPLADVVIGFLNNLAGLIASPFVGF
ncbi:MAG TPA: site-2 protease family protein [Syntrophomonadaceae bacterium]|nr:site-2 protease family protein [Syntrophomonadaceae bacterium]